MVRTACALFLYARVEGSPEEEQEVLMSTPKKKEGPSWIPKGSATGFSSKGVKKPVRATYYGKKAR